MVFKITVEILLFDVIVATMYSNNGIKDATGRTEKPNLWKAC
jgi:hypothetical protein